MNFHPVIKMPQEYFILDLTSGKDPQFQSKDWTIGRYNEKREGLYTAAAYSGAEKNGTEEKTEIRNIHMGIDIGCPEGTPVFAFDEGVVLFMENRSEPQDYGGTVICEHSFEGKKIYALYGHLSLSSLVENFVGKKISKGDVLAWVGNKNENGGWPPHLHFQLSWIRPQLCDMPGTVSAKNHSEALKIYPDPRIVLGHIY